MIFFFTLNQGEGERLLFIHSILHSLNPSKEAELAANRCSSRPFLVLLAAD
jgi:hypothetical protein